jgi:hypothetical protein
MQHPSSASRVDAHLSPHGRTRLSLILTLLLAACSDGGATVTGRDNQGGGGSGGADGGLDGAANGSGGNGGNGGGNGGNGGGSNGPDVNAPFDLQPSVLQTIDVDQNATTPVVQFTATQGGRAVNAAFSVDRGDAATITAGPASVATFSPTGHVGGLVTVTAGYQGQTIERQVLIRLRSTQNGASTSASQVEQIADDVAELTAGGGVGGVGGEGLGVAVSDATTTGALDAPASDGSAEGLRLLYPYDGTVWPRGLRAPLVMWHWNPGDADAVRLELETTSGSFRWSGTFGRPAILAQTTDKKFIRHPIPQDVWEAATQSAGGVTPSGERDKLTLKLTVVKDGVAAGPITQTWVIAPARLSGTIYYSSYGTQLAKNLGGAVGGDKLFGGAVLSIRVGDSGPKLAAGSGTSGGAERPKCRICHSVSAGGSRLIATNDTDENVAGGVSFSYAVSPGGITETAMLDSGNPLPKARGQFPAIYPDGSFALNSSGQVLTMPTASPIGTPTGLAAVTTNIGTPMFDTSGRLLAFNPMATPLENAKQKLVVMDYANATQTFSNPRVVVDNTGEPAQTRPGWPAFLPDGKSLVFHQQTKAGVDGNNSGDLHTRKGAMAQIHWTNTTDATKVTVLNALNGLDAQGKSYLPKLDAPVSVVGSNPAVGAGACTGDGSPVGDIADDHADDVNLNYEPTVSPVASGGYAWVIFVSRRMYGNVATIPPFCSDPRGVDLIQNITTKKLWVAAIDLGAEPGKDASNPAFYLPSQELLAGNSRGFWALDPCRDDGASCESGDQCCNGFCTQNATSGVLECGNMPPDASCSNEGDRCEESADCCDPQASCINRICSFSGPPV